MKKRDRCRSVQTSDGVEIRVHAQHLPSAKTIQALVEVVRTAARVMRQERWLEWDLGGEG